MVGGQCEVSLSPATPQKEWTGESLGAQVRHADTLHILALSVGTATWASKDSSAYFLSILKHSRQKLELTIASCIRSVT